MKSKTIWLCILVISVIWAFRILLTGTNKFGFVVFNVILAAIPLLLEPAFIKVSRHFAGKVKNLLLGVLGIVWLLFLPNAFYILTDFMHLNPDVLVNRRNESFYYAINYHRGEGIYIYDSLLIMAATVFGAYAGGLTLLHAYIYFKKKLSSSKAGALITFIMLLSAVGVYIGRFSRWNSWEGLLYPWRIAQDVFDNLLARATQDRFITVVMTIFIFEVISLVLVKKITALSVND